MPITLITNLAVSLKGDIRDENDPLYLYLSSPERMSTGDHTHDVLINAVKGMLQDPGSKPTMNGLIPPSRSYLRIDASIWIGGPDAPMGWDIGPIREGWHPDKPWATLRNVGHPSVRSGHSLSPKLEVDRSLPTSVATPPHADHLPIMKGDSHDLDEETPKPRPNSKRKRNQSSGARGVQDSPRKRKRTREPSSEDLGAANIKGEKENQDSDEIIPRQSEGEDALPSSVLDRSFMHSLDEPLFPGLPYLEIF